MIKPTIFTNDTTTLNIKRIMAQSNNATIIAAIIQLIIPNMFTPLEPKYMVDIHNSITYFLKMFLQIVYFLGY